MLQYAMYLLIIYCLVIFNGSILWYKKSSQSVSSYDYILLNLRHPGWLSNQEFVQHLIVKLQTNPKYQQVYELDDVYLFTKA